MALVECWRNWERKGGMKGGSDYLQRRSFICYALWCWLLREPFLLHSMSDF